MMMIGDIPLVRTDFAQVGTTNRGCMKVVPVDRIAERKKGRGLDKIVVGSQNGCVICLCRKHNDTQIVYKTLPGAPVESLCLGGALGTIMDKVFISAENGVRGISKKGKQFFAFDTNMAEPANKMYIYGIELVMCGRKTYYHFHDCVEANYVLLSEDIHDVVSLSTGGAWAGRGFTSIIASNDASLKVVENSAIDYSIPLNSVPYTLYLFMGDGGYNKQLLLYGTKNGHLGLAEAPPKKGTVIWEINTQSASAITCITCYPLTGNTTPDIIIGKEDGMIEIYTVDETDKAAFKQSYQCEESITGIGCGRVSDEGVDEIIVCTYTGWLFALSSSPLGGEGIATETGRPAPTQNVNVKVQQLKNELDELESKVNEERIRYEDLTKRGGNAHAFVPHFQIHDNFSFNNSLSAYTLTIELVIPIDYIILQSEVNLRMVEVEKNSAVISHTPCGQDEVPWNMLATYRCQANTTRIELRMKVDEGNYGFIHVYVCPKIHPKMCQVRSYEVKPLAMHIRVHQFDPNRPHNVLSITGNFSLAEAHGWLSQCLPHVPTKCPPQDTVTMNFQSAVDGGTQLQVTYSRGSCLFKSESMSTIAVIRERISEETTRRHLKVNISCELNDKSILHCLKLLHPKMLHLHNVTKKKNIAMALREIEANSDEMDWLSLEYEQILKDHDKIFEEAAVESLEDSTTPTIYEDLLLDRARLTGTTARSRLTALRDLLLNDYSLDNVSAFFDSNAD